MLILAQERRSQPTLARIGRSFLFVLLLSVSSLFLSRPSFGVFVVSMTGYMLHRSSSYVALVVVALFFSSSAFRRGSGVSLIIGEDGQLLTLSSV